MTEREVTREANGNSYDKYLQLIRPFSGDDIFHPFVMDEETFYDMLSKPSVVTVENIPLAIGVSDASRFVDTDRSLTIAQALGPFSEEDVLVSAVPLDLLADNMIALKQNLTASSGKLIFAEFDVTAEDTEQKLRGRLLSNGITTRTLEHPKLKSEASVNLFELNAWLINDTDKPEMTISEVVKKHTHEPRSPSAEGELLTAQADELGEEDLAGLWKLFSTRFNDISDNLPISLEESEEETRQLMTDSRYIFIYKKDGEGNIVACLFVSDSIAAQPWINPDFIERRNNELHNTEQLPVYDVFIPGIAASRNAKGSTAASEVLAGFTELLKHTNKPLISVRFECTDVSSQYVPLISMRAARQQPAFKNSTVHQIGQKKFVALTMQNN